MADIAALIAANQRRFAVARLLTAKGGAFRATARRLVAERDRYQRVARMTGVPWYVIAVIHEREASQRWDASIAQGDPWNHVSTHVPRGRGPFASWEEAAVDALVNCAPYAARNKDWSVGGTLTKLEEYNGLGYASRGRPSPYVWSGTDQYVSGKYIRDGVYDPDTVDSQLGCAGLLLAMMWLDPTITLTGMTISPATTPTVPVTPTSLKPSSRDVAKPLPPSITNPAKGSIGAAIASVLSAIVSTFKRK
jgi:lysozyme family protein